MYYKYEIWIDFILAIWRLCHSDTSFESGISDDYAIPPDAVSCSGDSTDWSTIAATISPSHQQKLSMPELCFEKCGHLAKLGGKLKTWRKRWFHLSTAGKLRYWKTQVSVIFVKGYSFLLPKIVGSIM